MKFIFVLLFSISAFASSEMKTHDLVKFIKFKMLENSLSQVEKISGHWDITQRDCAGFIRYVYKKSVGSTGPMWRDQKGAGTFYLSAQELVSFNFDYLTHDLSSDEIETGDIMVYNLPSPKEQIWHLVLLLKSPPGAPQKLLAMYHNGESGKKAKLKRVWAEDFTASDLGAWSARKENGNFIGVFRWKGWKSVAEKKDWKWFENKVSEK